MKKPPRKPSSLDDAGSEANGAGSASEDYEVGYGKPPKGSQFKPGQSGNKKGRKKGRRRLSDVVNGVMQENIPLANSNRKMPAFEVLIRTLRNQALKGDLKAVASLIMLLRACGEFNSEEPGEPEFLVTDNDKHLIADYVRRNTAPAGADNCSDESKCENEDNK